MPEQNQMTEEESLALITSMLNKARNSYIESGIGPLFWGALITFCSLFTFAELQFHFRIGFDIWVLSFFALFPQVYFMIRLRRQRNFKPHDEQAMNAVWGSFAICIFLLSFYVNQTKAPHQAALFMMMYGVPTFITGGIRRFRPMLAGGLVCWVCSIVSYYTELPVQMLLMAVSAASAWLIPGLILRRRYLKMKHV
jgi:hypothetical protein